MKKIIRILLIVILMFLSFFLGRSYSLLKKPQKYTDDEEVIEKPVIMEDNAETYKDSKNDKSNENSTTINNEFNNNENSTVMDSDLETFESYEKNEPNFNNNIQSTDFKNDESIQENNLDKIIEQDDLPMSNEQEIEVNNTEIIDKNNTIHDEKNNNTDIKIKNIKNTDDNLEKVGPSLKESSSNKNI